jgi:isoleucyl-tRNA synthetase
MSNKKQTHAEREKAILDYWDEHQCFEKSIEQRPADKPYVFYDGPPFATGMPHYGHIVGGVMKDVVPRFWTMNGYRVNRKWGWDCHGLPIENLVEKKMELNSKDDIEKLGVDVFNSACHAEVMRYANDWKQIVRRLGRWVDMENDYKTMDLTFMESVWWVFKQLFDKGLIYEDRQSMHVCPRCETVLSKFEVAQEYQDVTDWSVTAKFCLTNGKYEGADVLAWTTTPWTLPGNMMLAVHDAIEYVLVVSEGAKFILAKELVADVFGERDYTIEQEVLVTDLLGSTYEPLFPYFKEKMQYSSAFTIVKGDFVTTDEGTGVVHIASGFGEDDLVLGAQENVDPIMHVKMNGLFIDELVDAMEAEGYAVRDLPVKTKDDRMAMDVQMIKWLAHQDKLFSKQKYEHSYPHCWRCDTPLINYATTSWFVGVSGMVDKLTATANGVNWVPGHIKEGRFGKGLADSPDWSISRSRYWGTPLPIWRAQDGNLLVVGSVEELETLTDEKVTDLHKQHVDKLTIEKDGKVYTRVPEVLDCWFESGSMPYAQLHYPFENKELFDHGFPAEFIAEGVDQTRLWFHKLHVIGNALFDMPAYKNVIVNGIVLAEDGKKMSKRLQNYPDPVEVMEKYGADAVRYYLMSNPVVRAENLRFSEAGVAEVSKKFINIMRNVMAFYDLYRAHDDGRTPAGKHVLDAWVLARLGQTLAEETKQMEAYELMPAARVLQGFVTDLSTWYVRRSRDRFKVEGEDRAEAAATLRVVLDTFSKMVAPFMPFLGEELYQGVQGGYDGAAERMSVHLAMWPTLSDGVIESWSNEAVIETMGTVRALVSRALDAREEAGRPVKQVLSTLKVQLPSGELSEAYQQVLADEVNVKQIVVEKGEVAVELDTALTPELVREGLVREVVRAVNSLRKEAGLTIEDRIDLFVHSADEEVKKMFDEYAQQVQEGTLSSSISFEQKDELAHTKSFRASELDITVGF